MSIVGAPRLATRSRTIGFDLRLRTRTNVRDIHTMLSGTYNRENKSFPEDAIKIKVKDASDSTSVITLKENLSESGIGGQVQARGTEEVPVTRDVVLYQANWRKVIPKPGYGLRKLEADKYNLYEQHEAGMAEWRKEDHGYMIREGFLERYGWNLLVGDTAAQCEQWWNPNIFIPTLGIYNQPAFDRNRAIHTNNIVSGLIASGGLGQTRRRVMSAPVIEDMSNWCMNPLRLTRLKLPGLPTGSGFVVSVSEIMAGIMSNPLYIANNFGSQWKGVNQLSDKLIQWTGAFGAYNDMLFVTDDRQPTLLPSGSSAPYSMQAGYMVWNSRDLRNRTNPNIKDTAFIFGNGAYAEVEGEPMHWISDTQDYDFRKGVGIAGVIGDQLPIYLDPNSDAVTYQGGAAVILDFPNGGSQADGNMYQPNATNI